LAFVAISLKRKISGYREEVRLKVAAISIPAVRMAKHRKETILGDVFRHFPLSRQPIDKPVDCFVVFVERFFRCQLTLCLVLPKTRPKDTGAPKQKMTWNERGWLLTKPQSGFAPGLRK
jgi:hypothetical protein